ncbi:UFD1-domain-containing protein [Gloeophyllum trabeum ATCC 11539]|uniref:UFD1-domain-containing protein n=1 Tax=Gloeophyllum trabeum (strain ATCC 11539 / FP-39264 / Madison 617) TaxID=670483 RepID=S7RY28_GLOTA|nr:UFD1-domain-containing protein [Gloeophyllum trabeum ATCC 11539]EPQ58304.1 UFD1-domain-containing protein [Gloeophyllum trabeum ATCC 11539]
MGRPPPRSYDEYLKAYSVAMLPGRQRENVSYGGKIIMPPSALATLTQLDLESPWMFQLRNPSNPAASTHAGVLEFIAEEGCVHLPYWMMKTLRLNEGDPVRITGAELPKGKFVKIQAQSVHFLEVSDPKAVLEMALRNFTCLTQGDMIEIVYNSIVFGFLIMETRPGNAGISVLDTDLEVDFATPVGYKEPERPKAAPPPTMASKLKIDLNSASPGSSRPASSLGGAFAETSTGTSTLTKKGEDWESFKGRGETLGGRKTKGKGISHRKVEEVSEGSKIIRTGQRRIVNADILESGAPVPAPLNLPFGKLFFGYNIPPYQPPENASGTNGQQSTAFTGAGNTLIGRSSQSQASKGKGKEQESTSSQGPVKEWGKGQTLASPTPAALGAGGARVPRPPQRGNAKQKHRERSLTPDFGVDDDDDVIIIDSD